MVFVESLRELLQNRILRICRDPLDYQLLPRYAERQRVALTGEEQAQPVRDTIDCDTEQRMPGGINRVLVESDRELDEKIGELA